MLKMYSLIKRIIHKIYIRTIFVARYFMKKPLDFSIIVFQMGKVGSKTMQESLARAYEMRNERVEIYHSHILSDFDKSERIIRETRFTPEATLGVIKAGRRLRKKIDNSPDHQWKIISLVRDPIARNIGSFFQVLEEHIQDWREKEARGELEIYEVQEAFLNAVGIHSGPEYWFDKQMLAVFGIDVFSEPFPHEIGYKIYNHGSRISVLVIRLEDLNRVGKLAIKEFLGLDNFELFNINIGEEKGYANLYLEFKKHALPEQYIYEMYSGRYAKTFYSQEEVEQFYLKWSSGK